MTASIGTNPARRGAWLRRALGVALSARAERLGVSEVCVCGGAVTFRQRRPARVQTVLPGRDVEATVLYGQCRACQRGSWPVLTELRVDREGFTPALVRDEGTHATETLTAVPPAVAPAAPSALGPLTVGIDGGMVFVDQRWQEVKLACLYDLDERVSAVARILFGEGTKKAATWRTTQLDRLATDGADHIIDSLRFLGAHQRTVAKRTAVTDLERYLTTNRDRMRYQTFRAAGYAIGSGVVESAVSHVVQQRMKRVGMRWRSAGADAMLALRSIYRRASAWDRFWSTRWVA